ncbi:MAG: hypothetical protein OQL19_10265 [Gammaproteobacteria bacterium]|nr:hypothetical protein [Gammaproteobacteria bacterium]
MKEELRKKYAGYESGRHHKYSRAMQKELERMADKAEARGELSEYYESLRNTAKTYEKRAKAAHRGGSKQGGKRR